ncbi:acyl-CoA thioester hydrolase/BAAT C-terminal domain-containing protein [Streptomyces millisiae]|uniref:Acyl-CoA thioester hydrolase/BAAT C-terminal domain-containing protein n=1 Tax=Streptomyces millisiae TaxID=3075542 RepID=A0ABU2LJS2_9ACTN|nr:acyl-CoA thioester hydrolase/BAAT C-terminal domain-containing protein [Streptomyces sp. DSM 44918]MDT0317837.1 acyl-CoA thioester hydrolase/BAAT C-terminal domain-containing protein [Streptomyces sp. DSM 44918]
MLRDRGAGRVSILGASKGAEAALLVSALAECADAVIALAPTSVTWANVGPGRDGRERPYRSSWTWRGRPLPFVPYDDSWTPTEPEGSPVAVLGWYETSLATHADLLRAAAIPVAGPGVDLVLVAGGADRMWPSLRFARELAARRASAGREAVLVTRADAGHRIIFPGEAVPPPSPRFAHGGTAHADAALGAAAWPHVLAAVRGDRTPGSGS